MRLKRIAFSVVAARLSEAIHHPVGIPQLNILVCGWNNYRVRHGLERINFAQRVKDEMAWQCKHGLPVNKERFLFADELVLFSRYAGYNLE